MSAADKEVDALHSSVARRRDEVNSERLTISAQDLDPALLRRSLEALATVFPGVAERPGPPEGTVESVLQLVHESVPGWSVHLRGLAMEPDGHWQATIRENEMRDSDEVIGLGNAPTAALALLTALLSLAVQTSSR